jgi:predicted RNA methylase
MADESKLEKLKELLNDPENLEQIRINQEYSNKIKEYVEGEDQKFYEKYCREVLPYFY